MKENCKKQQKKNKQRQKGARGAEPIVKWGKLNDFIVHLSFLLLICKASLIFKSNLELALSIILKQENYMSQSMLRWSVEDILFDMLLNPSFKMTASFANISKVNLYTRKDFKSLGIGSIILK